MSIMTNESLLQLKGTDSTYSETLSISSGAHVFPMVVIATPVMLIKTAVTLATFTESFPISAPKTSVKSPDVEVKMVVLATLVFARAEFDKYCMQYIRVRKPVELQKQITGRKTITLILLKTEAIKNHQHFFF